MSSSNNVEQFTIMHDQKTIEYVKKRLDNIMQQFTVFYGVEQKTNSEKDMKNTGKNAYNALIKE